MGTSNVSGPHSPIGLNTNSPPLPDIFGDPWAYRIADFPKNYKLFVIRRQKEGENHPREDYYLCGGFPHPLPPPTHNIAYHFFSGGEHDYRSPQEFYPHMHWLLENAQGVNKPCICKYCDPSRTQEQINAIFPLPPCRKTTKKHRSPKTHQKTRKHQRPKGVTSQREMVTIRNSITTGLVTTPRHHGDRQKVIGHKTSNPFRS